jgi:hypothetical protein
MMASRVRAGRLLLMLGLALLVMRARVMIIGLDAFVNRRACGLEFRGTALDRIGGTALCREVLARAAIAASAASATATTASAGFALLGRVSGGTRFEARRLLLLFLIAQHLGGHHPAGLRLLLRPLLARLTRFACLTRLALIARFALLAGLAGLAGLALLPRLALFARLAWRTRLLLLVAALARAISPLSVATRRCCSPPGLRLCEGAAAVGSHRARMIPPLAVAARCSIPRRPSRRAISLALSVAGPIVLERGLCLRGLRRGLGAGTVSAGFLSQPKSLSMRPTGRASGAGMGARVAGARVAGRCAATGASTDIGAGWSGRMPFTSGSGRGATFSGPLVGNPTASSSGTVTIS